MSKTKTKTKRSHKKQKIESKDKDKDKTYIFTEYSDIGDILEDAQHNYNNRRLDELDMSVKMLSKQLENFKESVKKLKNKL